MGHEQIFLDHLATIDRVITQVCRHHHVSDDESEEFRSLAHMKLIENDYRVLCEHEGRASMRTYLTVVLQRTFLDYRNSMWGKWRPSVEARSHGQVAIRLEQLILRDGYSFEEAYETLRTNYHVTAAREELENLASRLPLRVIRKSQSDEVLVVVPAPGPSPEAVVSRDELRARGERVHDALRRALLDLAPADRLIIKLRFVDGLTVAQIARVHGMDQKALYRQLDQLKGRLRRTLEEQGVDSKTLFDDDEARG